MEQCARTAAAQQGKALEDHCRHPNPWNNAARTTVAQQGEAPEDHSLHYNSWNNAARTAVGKHGGPPEDYNLHHPNHRTDLLKHKEEMDTPILNTNSWCMYTLQVMQTVEKRKRKKKHHLPDTTSWSRHLKLSCQGHANSGCSIVMPPV